MTGAVALAVVLVVAVAGISMALESQHNAQGPVTRRVPRPPMAPPSPRRPRADRIRDRGKSESGPVSAMPPPVPDPTGGEIKGPELLRIGETATAKVISVVDERTIGPVTRSRLVLQVQPTDGDGFEVTVRHAFPTPESRGLVKVGGSLPVRYDKDDRTRVVIDLPQV